MTKPDKKITSRHISFVWAAFPSTIEWIQIQRDSSKPTDKLLRSQLKQNGINQTIILLSAACIEGFLVECLQSFASGELNSKNTFDNRLNRDYLEQVSKATFRDFSELFRLAVGKPLSELIENDPMRESIRVQPNSQNGQQFYL